MSVNNSKFVLRIKKPDIQTILLMMWLCEVFVLTVTRYILAAVGIYESMTRDITLWSIASVPLFLFLLYARRINPRKYIGFVILFFIIIFSMLISILANPALEIYFTRPVYGVERILRPDCALYAFLFFSLFEDPVKLRKNLTVFAYLDFIYLVVMQLIPALMRGYWIDIGPNGQEMRFSYNLSFGYAIAFPTIIFLYNAFKKKNIWHYLFGIFGIWCVVTQGNRGSLLILLIFVGLMILSNIIGSNNVSKKALKIMGILLAIVTVAILGNYLLDYAIFWMNTHGVNSRTLQMLLNGTISDDNGRDFIWATVIDAIENGGIFGHGMLGDRPFVSPIHTAGYSHNIFLELLVSYGLIGFIIILYIICDAVRMIFFCKENNWRELYIILFSCSCQLLLSMSFWYVWQFWAAAAVAYRYKRLKQ